MSDNLKWIFKYNKIPGKTMDYNVTLEKYEISEPEFAKIKREFDQKIETFLDAYHSNLIIPMKVEMLGDSFMIAMDGNSEITIEKIDERMLRSYS